MVLENKVYIFSLFKWCYNLASDEDLTKSKIEPALFLITGEKVEIVIMYKFLATTFYLSWLANVTAFYDKYAYI